MYSFGLTLTGTAVVLGGRFDPTPTPSVLITTAAQLPTPVMKITIMDKEDRIS